MRHRWRKPLVWLGCVLPILIAVRILSSEGFNYYTNLLAGEQGNDYEDGNPAVNAPMFIAGSFMVGRWPQNISFCQWQYDLPRQISYSPSRVSMSPELGEQGSYRVLASVIKPDYLHNLLPKVTLCTHATADQVYNIVEIAKRWEGPVSFSIFAPGADAALSVALLDRACRCEPAMAKVSVHFIFPITNPPSLVQSYDIEGDCLALDLRSKEEGTVRKNMGMTYPINVARNVARMQAYTLRVMVSDIELLPSKKLASSFMRMVREKVPKRGVVFVVPVFEIEAKEEPPSTKRDLIAACKTGIAGYFHRFLCPHCQRFPGLTRWMLTPDRGRATPLLITRREVPHHRWEPVFIGSKEDPLYTEEMTWEGRQDKMAQMFEMCLLNYRLVVLDGVFLVHTPGIKRKPANGASDRLRPHERRNSRIYQSVVKRLLKLHPTNKKCRQ